MFLATSQRRWLLFVLGLLPCAHLVWRVIENQLGPEPGRTLVLNTGTWAVVFLALSLAVTPVKRLFGWRFLQAHRRMLGLFCLFYALLHALGYWLFLLGGNWQDLGADIAKRPFILASLPALLLLIVLGVTSHRRLMRQLAAYWQPLHRSVYAVALLIIAHVVWQIRASYGDALLWGGLLGSLLALRLYWWFGQWRSGKKNWAPG